MKTWVSDRATLCICILHPYTSLYICILLYASLCLPFLFMYLHPHHFNLYTSAFTLFPYITHMSTHSINLRTHIASLILVLQTRMFGVPLQMHDSLWTRMTSLKISWEVLLFSFIGRGSVILLAVFNILFCRISTIVCCLKCCLEYYTDGYTAPWCAACTWCKNLRHLVLTVFAPAGARRSVWCEAACTGGWLSGRGWRYLVTNQQPYLVRWEAHMGTHQPSNPMRDSNPNMEPEAHYKTHQPDEDQEDCACDSWGTLQYGQAQCMIYKAPRLIISKASWTLTSDTDTLKRVTIMPSTLTQQWRSVLGNPTIWSNQRHCIGHS